MAISSNNGSKDPLKALNEADLYEFLFNVITDPSPNFFNFVKRLNEFLGDLFLTDKSAAFAIIGGLPFTITTTNKDWISTNQNIDFLKFPDFSSQKMFFRVENWNNSIESTTYFFKALESKDLILLFATQFTSSKNQSLTSNSFSQLSDKANDISIKIAKCLSYFLDSHFAKTREDLFIDVFKHQLDSIYCWNKILEYASVFIPNIPHLNPFSDLKYAIFSYTENDSFLRCEAIWNKLNFQSDKVLNFSRYHIKLSDSIFESLLFSDKKFLLFNLSNSNRSHLPHFLIKNSFQSQSALLLKVEYLKSPIAILYIENSNADFFSKFHIHYYQYYSDLISPIVNTIKQRTSKRRAREISLLYAMDKLLKKLASTYHHKTAQLFPKSHFAINYLKSNIEKENKDIYAKLIDLDDFIEDFKQRSTSFLSALPDYLNFRKTDIDSIVNDVLKEFKGSRKAKNVDIEYTPANESIYVFASKMLQEHLYNLIENSLLSINNKFEEKNISKGHIQITIADEESISFQNHVESLRKICLSIKDNGNGVSPDIFKNILNFGFTTRKGQGGTGYGLPAAKEYLESIGGEFEVKNYYGEGFTVNMFFPKFDPNYHK